MIYLAALAVLVVYIIFAFNIRFLGREYYGPRLGTWVAHWVGVAIQIAFVIVMTYLFLNWLRGAHTRAELWTIGVMWAVLAEAWELFAFHWVQRRPWADVLAEYNPLTGHGWWLVPLTYLLAPVLVYDWLLALLCP
ncbi:MAG TPA: hypothetical protein VKB51_18385 [bacterium]|nr:hypothetical protein [bacterium]